MVPPGTGRNRHRRTHLLWVLLTSIFIFYLLQKSPNLSSPWGLSSCEQAGENSIHLDGLLNTALKEPSTWGPLLDFTTPSSFGTSSSTQQKPTEIHHHQHTHQHTHVLQVVSIPSIFGFSFLIRTGDVRIRRAGSSPLNLVSISDGNMKIETGNKVRDGVKISWCRGESSSSLFWSINH